MRPLWGGMPVILSDHLPLPVSPGEEARRIVRHGMADVLEWLGEEVGPKPSDRVHVILGVDPATGAGDLGVAFVSAAMLERLRREGWGAE